MTSKTSYFEPALALRGLRKTFPIWFSYLLLWILFVPVQILNQYMYHPVTVIDLSSDLLSFATISIVTAAIFALALAWTLFHWMFRTNTAYDIAALPIRRESLFFTHVGVGLAIALIANALIAIFTFLATTLVSAPALSACLQWFWVSLLAFLAFFGFAVLMVMVVGNAVAMPLIYVVLNFAVILLVAIIADLLSSFVYGLGDMSDNVLYVAQLFSPLMLVFTGSISVNHIWSSQSDTIVRVELSGLPYLYIIAVAGTMFLVVAFFLFRRREMERSGDVIAVKALRPVFLYLFSLGCALVIGYLLAMFSIGNFHYNFPAMLGLQFTGAFIGYFAAQMMLQKSLRVFSGKRTWLGFGTLCLLLAALFCSARFGMFGYSRKVPDADTVRSVSLNHNTTLTEPEDIAQVIALHEIVAADQNEQLALIRRYNSITYISFDYELNNGSTLRRRFEVCSDGALPEQLDTLLNQPHFIIAREGIPGELSPGDFAGCTIYGTDENGDEHYFSYPSSGAYEFYTTCILPDLGTSSIGKEQYSRYSTYETSLALTEDGSVYTNIYVEFEMAENWRPYSLEVKSEYTYSNYYGYQITNDAVHSLDALAKLGFVPMDS